MKKGYASTAGNKDAILKMKSYLESPKYQKGIRVLHDFLVASIIALCEVSVNYTDKHIYKG